MAEKNAAAEFKHLQQKDKARPPMRAFADMAAPGGLVNTRNIHRVQLGSQQSVVLSKENQYKDFHRRSQATFSPSTFKSAASRANTAATSFRGGETILPPPPAVRPKLAGTLKKQSMFSDPWGKMKARDHTMYNLSEV